MEILFEGIILRPWIIGDTRQLARIADNKKIADNLRDGFPFPYSEKDARQWLRMVLPENNPPRFFAIMAGNNLAGSIGIVTKAIKAASSYAFREFDLVRIYAEPFADNAGSRKALGNAGFILEATLKRNVIKNGILRDSCIYSVLREEFRYFIPA